MRSSRFSRSLLLALLFSTGVGAELGGVHCPLGCPSNPDGNDVVTYHLFTLSNNATTKFADWVAYEVDIGNFGISPGRNFKRDPLLDADETLEKSDYSGASSSSLNADKGHQAPLASFARSVYWYETNYLSNITPQDADLNQGPWRLLEDAVRRAAKFREPLYVITGPTYEGQRRQMPNADEAHDVPDGYFKIVYDRNGNAAGYWMPQDAARDADYCSFRKSLSEIQAKVNFSIPALTNSAQMRNALGC